MLLEKVVFSPVCVLTNVGPPDRGAGLSLQIDPVVFEEFRTWRAMKTLDPESDFLAHVIREEIAPCLSFADKQVMCDVSKSVSALILRTASLSLTELSSGGFFLGLALERRTVRACVKQRF